ncbi:MAG: hypothetical protein NTV21_01440 [Planctomycetota bacterium]|nr:hypothetical protein [Planctomycetota bacterium]
MAQRSSSTNSRSGGADLAALEELKPQFGGDVALRKCELLARLRGARLGSAEQVRRLHEAALFLCAYADDAGVREEAERLLAGFGERPDLKRCAGELVDSGIAGTTIGYPFFGPTARRLVARHGERMRVNWPMFDGKARLEGRLALLASYSETPGLDEYDMPLAKWVARLKGKDETDAQFLVKRLARLGASDFERDTLYEELGLELLLEPGPDTPSRTRERFDTGPLHFQREPLRRGRPDIVAELRRKPRRIVELDEKRGAELVALAQDAMVTRSRDLDAFMHGDPRDTRLVDCGDGLVFAAIGVKPERRLMLESVYAFLTLKNGIPMGYVLTSALFSSSEIAYNVFDTFRGGEAGAIYGRVLSMTRAVFGSDAFTVYPYQLGGDGNKEGLKSGAWWFYQKLGFRPRDAATLALMESELAAQERDPTHRSSIATLKQLAKQNVYWHAGEPRDDVIGVFALEQVGLAITDHLAARFGSDRERGEAVCADEAAKLLGARGWKDWEAGEKLWWRRWAPLATILPGIERWSAKDKAELVDCVRAKGGRRESEFVWKLDRHRKARAALRELARDGWKPK